MPQAERGKPGRAPQRAVFSGTLEQRRALGEIGERADDHEHRDPDHERRQHRPAPQDREQCPP